MPITGTDRPGKLLAQISTGIVLSCFVTYLSKGVMDIAAHPLIRGIEPTKSTAQPTPPIPAPVPVAVPAPAPSPAVETWTPMPQQHGMYRDPIRGIYVPY